MTSRWLRHVNDSKKSSSSIFHRAIAFYGTGDEVWYHEILQTVETQDEANEAEKYWIHHFNCNALNEGSGYNMTDGGEGVTGYRHSEERREKISKANFGKTRSEETKIKMRKPKSEEHKAKLREALNKARQRMKENIQSGKTVIKKASSEKIEKLKKAAQMPHVKEAKRQAQLKRWKKYREEKSNIEEPSE
jgi:group I intron endonuclease